MSGLTILANRRRKFHRKEPCSSIYLFFNSSNSEQLKSNDYLINTKTNFLTAVAVVSFFNLAVLAGISAPAAATAAALSTDPTFESDGKFHWNFTYSEGIFNFSLELTAKVNATAVAWEMFVSGQFQTQLDHVLWYDGESQLDRSSGFWQFYNLSKPTTNHETVKIDWNYAADDDRTLTFTDNNSESLGMGNCLRYQVAGDDVSMVFFDVMSSDSTQVVVNSATGAGYIIKPNYNNGEKACWDETQEDIPCAN